MTPRQACQADKNSPTDTDPDATQLQLMVIGAEQDVRTQLALLQARYDGALSAVFSVIRSPEVELAWRPVRSL